MTIAGMLLTFTFTLFFGNRRGGREVAVEGNRGRGARGCGVAWEDQDQGSDVSVDQGAFDSLFHVRSGSKTGLACCSRSPCRCSCGSGLCSSTERSCRRCARASSLIASKGCSGCHGDQRCACSKVYKPIEQLRMHAADEATHVECDDDSRSVASRASAWNLHKERKESMRVG